MKIIFNTKIDAYKTRTIGTMFPWDMQVVPRNGEKIGVNSSYVKQLENKNLPIRLEVIDVEYKERKNGHENETIVYCELHYNETDAKIAKMAGAKLM